MDDEDLAREALTIDPGRSTIVTCFGGKGSGKSEACRALFDAWPLDRVVLDPTGDARPDDPATIPVIAPFASQLPEPDPDGPDPHRVTVWARLDPRSPTFEFDQAQAMNMALGPRHRRKAIWRDEWGIGTSSAKMSEPDRTLLMSSRHWNASGFLACPRPRLIPKLSLLQSDLTLVFKVTDPDDREHIAKNFGVSLPLFEREYHSNQRRGKFSFLLLDRAHDAILNCPALPGITARGPRA